MAEPSGDNKTPSNLVPNNVFTINLKSAESSAYIVVTKGSSLASVHMEVYDGTVKKEEANSDTHHVLVPNGKTYSVRVEIRAANYSNDNTLVTIYNFDITREALSAVNTLESIKKTGTNVVAGNSPKACTSSELPTNTNVFELDSMPTGNVLQITVVKKDPLSIVNGINDGNAQTDLEVTNLKPGNTQLRIEVVAQDGVSKAYYVVNVYVPATPSVTNIQVTNKESSVTANRALTPSFDPTVQEYRVDVLHSDGKETVTVTLENLKKLKLSYIQRKLMELMIKIH